MFGERAQGEHVVGGDQRIFVDEIDLVLAGTMFVVRALDANAHRAESRDDRVAGFLARVVRGEIEVRADVAGGGAFAIRGVAFEEVELDLRRNAQAGQGAGTFDRAAQRRARAALERRTIRHRDVADQTRFRAVGRRPRVECVRRWVGAKHHIEFFAPHESVDRSAVERDASVERAFELARGDRHVLAHAEDVGKDQAHEPYVLFAGEFDDVALVRGAPWFTGSGVHRSQPPVGE